MQICADVLFQPLTLLDCLHTFCGSCLKEWFSFQALQATSLHPYTCPSCRAPVRGTRPDAKVNTLLDLWLQANPDRGRTEEEKSTERKKYKPGDNVLPKLRRRGASDASRDRRLVEEVRQQSLQDVNISDVRASNRGETSSGRRRRDRSHGGGSRSASRHRSSSGHVRRRSSGTHLNTTEDQTSGRSSREPSPRNPPGRQVEHQSSLRSLLSTSDDPAQIEEEIMRQILEDGLLDSLDLNDIDVTREDEISERIADAFRQRQEERRRERRLRENRNQTEDRSNSALEGNERRRNRPPDLPSTQSSHPPVSRPHLMEAVNQGNVRQRRSASQSSALSVSLTTSSGNVTGQPNADSSNGLTRSTTDLSTSPRSVARAADSERQAHRRTTEPVSSSHHSSRSISDPTRTSAPATPRSAEFEARERSSQSPVSPSSSQTNRSPHAVASIYPASSTTRSYNHSSPALVSVPSQSQARTTPILHSQTSPSSSSQRPTPFIEPSVSCNRCGKQNIQYDLHYNCQKCEGGTFNLCLRCYRLSRGCLHWYGFGSAAKQQYERQAPAGGYPLNADPPHSLTGHRYLRPHTGDSHSTVPDDPSKRLQSGVFCDVCSAFANFCYWKCDTCNDGEWGYCNNCVNQGKHCTHSLLPLAHQTSNEDHQTVHEAANEPRPGSLGSDLRQDQFSPAYAPKSASILLGLGLITISNLFFRPLTFSTLCDICRYPIQPSRTRFHCPKCNNGDYDICTSCYTSLVARGGIKPEDGHHGWRRCLRGHRMVVVGFEDRGGGQKRIVVNDLVGGHTLNEEEVFGEGAANDQGEASWREADGTRRTYRFAKPLIEPSRQGSFRTIGPFPPDGGVGLRLTAKFTFFPADGVKDELCFPKGAEIREAEDINGDWLWGVYCASKGLIPGNYVQRV